MESDARFKHVAFDPRFKVRVAINIIMFFFIFYMLVLCCLQGIPKRVRKVQIDKRFSSMFSDERFKVKCMFNSTRVRTCLSS